MTSLSMGMIELTESRVACENSRFTVYLDHIRMSAGQEVPDYLVIAPKIVGKDLCTGVAVLPCHDGRIGLLRLYRHPVRIDVWELPRGFLDAGESPATSALRELEEETGFICAQTHLLDLGTVLPEAGILRGRVHLYAALECQKVRDFPGVEIGHREFRWFTGEEIRGLLRNSNIEDATTIAALYKLLLLHPSIVSQ
jgi:8-oxo-dGTP pyrophosphatase MutT (NUDIX family)